MPSAQRVAVDSSPKLHGIFDTISSTFAARDARTRLPSEFYDQKAWDIINRIVVEEEYSGYKESLEYRQVGIGAFLYEVVQRMVDTAQNKNNTLKIALFGGHDSTIAATLASLGALEGENGSWPSYTSSLAVELFRYEGSKSERSRTNGGVLGRIARPWRLRGGSNSLDYKAGWYVRLRYNDRVVTLPGCQPASNHLEGHKDFCTFVCYPLIVAFPDSIV